MPPFHLLTLRCALLAAVLATVVGLASLAPPAARAAQKGVVPEYTWGISAADQARTAGAAQDLGAQWVRLEADWARIEPSRGGFDATALATLDQAVAVSRAAGQKIVMLVGTAPQWASGTAKAWTYPQNPGDYAAFAGWLASRYAGQVAGYEIWNEENTSAFWGSTASPAAYAQLLAAAAPAVRGADPQAKVVFGGLSLNDWSFVDQAYAAMPNLGGYYDVMATHPYSNGQPPEKINHDAQGNITPDSFAGYRQVEATMQAHGDAKPIWLTEMGWASDSAADKGVGGQTVQASYLTRAYKFLEQDPEVQVAIWYETRNCPEYAMGSPASDDANDWIDQLGLMDTDFSPKPAYYAFKAYVPPAPPSTAPAPAASVTPAPQPAAAPAPASGPAPPAAAAAVATTTAALVPTSTRIRRTSARCPATIAGRVTGARGGTVLLALDRLGAHRWSRVGLRHASVSGRGAFSVRTRCATGARLRIRAHYVGGAHDAPSTSGYVYLGGSARA